MTAPPNDSGEFDATHRRIRQTAQHRRSTRCGLPVVLMLVIAALACVERTSAPPSFESEDNAFDVWSQTACETAKDCDCGPRTGSHTCAEAFDATWAEVRTLAEERDLTFNAACFENLIGFTGEVGCQLPESHLFRFSSVGACKLYFGDREVGEPCTQAPFIDDCVEEARCLLEVCVGELARIPEGETCGSTDLLGVCDIGLVCELSFDASGEPHGVCTRPATEGESCFLGGCEPGFVCDQSADNPVCVRFPGLGQPCVGGLCDGPTRCDELQDPPTCGPRLDDGAPCETPFDCKSGNCTDNLCAPVRPIACDLVHGPLQ